MSGTKDDSIQAMMNWFYRMCHKGQQKNGWFNNLMKYLVSLQDTKFWVEHCALFLCATSGKSSPFRKGWRWVRPLVWKKNRQTVCRKCLMVHCLYNALGRAENLETCGTYRSMEKNMGTIQARSRCLCGSMKASIRVSLLKVMRPIFARGVSHGMHDHIFCQNLLWWLLV